MIEPFVRLALTTRARRSHEMRPAEPWATLFSKQPSWNYVVKHRERGNVARVRNHLER
jgi:hypothetical protein